MEKRRMHKTSGTYREVTALAHEVRDDAVELGALVVKRLQAAAANKQCTTSNLVKRTP
jgi:hypothetical protein